MHALCFCPRRPRPRIVYLLILRKIRMHALFFACLSFSLCFIGRNSIYENCKPCCTPTTGLLHSCRIAPCTVTGLSWTLFILNDVAFYRTAIVVYQLFYRMVLGTTFDAGSIIKFLSEVSLGAYVE
jgi:hypothetical protein